MGEGPEIHGPLHKSVATPLTIPQRNRVALSARKLERAVSRNAFKAALSASI
ncbi:hypothetical protein AKJ09_01160 [Labilithrix luteola]|uniref:Uncharacterized protein n=1 Tax=Labilithrix luteola TaxID=1391654 RepID=A0A0K1PM71_9BACT|nr:hypothetical protein AKJ09_01160 [Labilithrix luteola]